MSAKPEVPEPADALTISGGLTCIAPLVTSSIVNKAYVDNQIMQNDDGNVEIKGDLVVTAGGEKVNVCDFITAMQDRMLILQPNFQAMEEYPALKDAYNQYKMLEKLLMDNHKPEKK